MARLGHLAGVSVVLLVLLVAPSAAQGAFVQRDASTGTVFYIADPGEANDLTIVSAPGAHVFTDLGAAVDAVPPCVTDGTNAACPAGDNDVVAVVLDDEGDSLLSGSEFPLFVCGGDGDDSITAGDNDDNIRGEGGDDTINGGGGDDFLRTEELCGGGFPSASSPERGGCRDGRRPGHRRRRRGLDRRRGRRRHGGRRRRRRLGRPRDRTRQRLRRPRRGFADWRRGRRLPRGRGRQRHARRRRGGGLPLHRGTVRRERAPSAPLAEHRDEWHGRGHRVGRRGSGHDRRRRRTTTASAPAMAPTRSRAARATTSLSEKAATTPLTPAPANDSSTPRPPATPISRCRPRRRTTSTAARATMRCSAARAQTR